MKTVLLLFLALGIGNTWAVVPGEGPPEAKAELRAAAEDSLLGTWVNADSKTRWYAIVRVFVEEGKVFMELWATQGGAPSKDPVAKIPLPLDVAAVGAPGRITVSKDYGFMEETLTLRMRRGELEIKGEGVFKDGTKRDREVTEMFVRAGK